MNAPADPPAPEHPPDAGDTPARSARERLTELHVALRTEGEGPLRRALAVGLGVAIGCTPFWGLHLLLATLLARLFRLSRVITYLSAHISNPITFPFLLWIEVGIGHWLLTREWPELSLARLREAGVMSLGRDLLLGAGVLGVGLGALLTVVTYLLGVRNRRRDDFAALREAAAEPYLACGITHWEFVRGKLRYDPVYRRLVESRLLPRPGRLVDLGCGRGILLALLSSPVEEWRNAPPRAAAKGPVRVRHVAPPGTQLLGIDCDPRAVKVARRALASAATIQRGDLAQHPVPACATAVLLDVLHYLPAAAQEDLLARTTAALGPHGLLLMREVDAAGGARFQLTRTAERLRAILRGHLRQSFHYRSREEWRRLLVERGLRIEGGPAVEGTPFANVLLVARKGAAPERPAALRSPAPPPAG